jgi:hypothetical protein
MTTAGSLSGKRVFQIAHYRAFRLIREQSFRACFFRGDITNEDKINCQVRKLGLG